MQGNRLYDIKGKTHDRRTIGGGLRDRLRSGAILVSILAAVAAARFLGLDDRSGGNGGFQAGEHRNDSHQDNYGYYSECF